MPSRHQTKYIPTKLVMGTITNEFVDQVPVSQTHWVHFIMELSSLLKD